jgi:type II restriction/modification system DNA methylase subunit YeeA
LQAEFDDRILRLRVLDPSMGSGHFLLRACNFLAEEIATHQYARDEELADATGESAVVYWKRKVAENCLYGVDLNGLAVELAKLAL